MEDIIFAQIHAYLHNRQFMDIKTIDYRKKGCLECVQWVHPVLDLMVFDSESIINIGKAGKVPSLFCAVL